MMQLSPARQCHRLASQQQPRATTLHQSARCCRARPVTSAACPDHASQHAAEQQDTQQRGGQGTSRAQLLRLAALAAVAQQIVTYPAMADETTRPLPKAYVLTINRLIKSLRESLEAETSGAPEYEVRRKADPAKEQVREFVGKWRDNPAVMDNASHDEIKAALLELAAYYKSAGQRSRLAADVRDSVLAHLEAAEAAVPKTEEKVLGLF